MAGDRPTNAIVDEDVADPEVAVLLLDVGKLLLVMRDEDIMAVIEGK